MKDTLLALLWLFLFGPALLVVVCVLSTGAEGREWLAALLRKLGFRLGGK